MHLQFVRVEDGRGVGWMAVRGRGVGAADTGLWTLGSWRVGACTSGAGGVSGYGSGAGLGGGPGFAHLGLCRWGVLGGLWLSLQGCTLESCTRVGFHNLDLFVSCEKVVCWNVQDANDPLLWALPARAGPLDKQDSCASAKVEQETPKKASCADAVSKGDEQDKAGSGEAESGSVLVMEARDTYTDEEAIAASPKGSRSPVSCARGDSLPGAVNNGVASGEVAVEVTRTSDEVHCE